jgi:site-specific DNA-methyltransferase (adenine-specific)
MPDLKEQTALAERRLEDAATTYRTVMDRHLQLRGARRDAHKIVLEQSREEMDRIEEDLLSTRLALWEQHLQDDTLSEAERQNLEKERDKARTRLQKLHSRLSHEEWLNFTRSVWGFKETESEAKTGLHPAQFSAVIPYRLIKMYSLVGETVLDPFVGTGTTLIEARKLGRKSVGLDVNPEFLALARRRLQEEGSGLTSESAPPPSVAQPEQLVLQLREEQAPWNLEKTELEPILRQEDARHMTSIDDESIHLVVTHPPYWNAVRISDRVDDLSNVGDESYEEFLGEMDKVFTQLHRVLQPDRVLAIVTGDVMRKVNGVTQLFPLHADYIHRLRPLGFVLWDLFIWETKIRLSGGKPMMGSYPYPHKLFSQFAHNYVLIFRK